LVTAILVAFAWPALSAQAQDATGSGSTDRPELAPPVEVTAYRVPVLLSETTQGVSVITSQEIVTRNPASIVDLLQEVPGVQVDQLGSPGGVASVYIRGSDPEQVLVLIDGVRVNDLMLSRGGSYDFSAIDPATIERIEIIRGGGSAIFGANAMGGVVNIITKTGNTQGFHGTFGGGLGGQNYGTGNIGVSGGNDKIGLAVSASKLRDGRDEDGGHIDLSTVNASLHLRPTDAVEMRLFTRYNERDGASFPDSSGGILFAVDPTLAQQQAREITYGADLTIRATDELAFNAKASRFDRVENIDAPFVPPGLGNLVPSTVSRTDFTRETALLSAALKLPLDSDLTVGYEHMREAGDSHSVFGPAFVFPPGFNTFDFSQSRSTDSLFAALKAKPIVGLVLMLDIRRDVVSDEGSENSPSAGVRYTFPNTDTTLKARYSEGFRPPSFYALGNPLVGNPKLVSETSKGGEVGVEQGLLADRARLSVTAFKTRYKNLVDFDPTIPPFGQLVNRSTVDADGAEALFAIQPQARLTLGFTYTYVNAVIEDSTAHLQNRPKNRAGFSLDYAWSEAWRFSWRTAFVGQVFSTSAPTGEVTLDAYSRTDVALSYKWRELTAIFAIDNLFNEKYQQYVGFENPGIRARASVQVSF
jgi:iron complex outermembrane receptor protein/vitamin B12 transporter